MLRFIARRLAISVPVLFIVLLITYFMNELVPGDAATALAGEDATPELLEQLRHEMGLDRPWLIRFFEYVGLALTGDLGTSIYSSTPVVTLIMTRLPVTMSLVVLVLVFAVLVGVPLGAWSAVTKRVWVDKLITGVSVFTIAAPGFLIAIFLVVIFAVQLGWFPPSGFVDISNDPARWAWHITLPAIALTATPAAELARMTRASVVDVMGSDYLRTSRAKGLTPAKIFVKHAMKNASIPVVTIFGLLATRIIGGAVILEQIFNLPGIGTLTINSVLTQDTGVLMGVVAIIAAVTLIINLLTDISYGYFNPSLRAS